MREDNFQIDSAAVSDRGLSEKRPQNEDSFLELKERAVYAVADGVGGAQAGDVASQMAVEILGEAFINSRPNSDAEDVMKDAIQQANSAIFQTSHELAQLSTMATTIVALQVSGNIATIGHVGDSRLYRLDGNGNLYRETQDHSVVEEEVRAGRMTAAQAATHPSRNVISRALGAEPTVEIDMKTIMFEPEATFLLCSDGITRHLDDFEIRDLLNSNQNPDAICEQMKELCYQRGAEDNLTAVIVKVAQARAAQTGGNGQVSDFEEPTVVPGRNAPEHNALIVEHPPEEGEIPTRNLSIADLPAAPPSDTPAMETNRTEAIQTEKRPIVPKLDTVTVPAAPVENIEPKRDVIVVETDPKTDNGTFGKLLSSLLLLLLGAGLGAGAYYLWQQNNPPKAEEVKVPQITQMQTKDIPYSAFEDSRRKVDENPEAYIAAAGSLTQNAEGFYLLGRAYLLSNKVGEAKKAFDSARTHLAEIGPVNSRVLATDIEAGLAIANNSFAYEAFKKNLAANKPDPAVPTSANVNANVNSGNVPSMPVNP